MRHKIAGIQSLAGGILFLLLISSPAFAEVIRLKSGSSIEGRIIEKTDEYVKIDFQGTVLTYFTNQISKIEGPAVPAPLRPAKRSILYNVLKKLDIKSFSDLITLRKMLRVFREQYRHSYKSGATVQI